MNAGDDAHATWELLDETERKILAACENVRTPQGVGSAVSLTWQRVHYVACSLKELGLLHVTRLPKQTSYELTGRGKACLQAGLGKRPLTWSMLTAYARAAGTPDGALVADERGHAVYSTAPSLNGERINLRVTQPMTMALTWQQMRDYAGVESFVTVWFADPEPRPVTGVRLETGPDSAVLVIEGRAET